jgi:LmbE family N-acetylglucosaminyl deacetylase
MTSETLKILIFGAHPDDAEWYAGGVVALYGRQGHQVRMVSLTNGDAGHYEMSGDPLARRRRKEAAAAGACLGAETIVLHNHDGALFPTLQVRKQVIRIMREFRPDLVMTHRPWDYHPDHRAAGQVVQDAMVQVVYVPSVVPDVPALQAMPVVVYLWDEFKKPYPFIPDVVVGIDDVVERKIDALQCHVSQMVEGWSHYSQDKAPRDLAARRVWLRRQLEPHLTRCADLYRDRLTELYGEGSGARIKYAEAFEVCEYGAPLSDDSRKRLFPFF